MARASSLCTATYSSISRHRRVDPLGPRQDAALEVLDFLEAGVAQKLRRFQAAHAALAMNDQLSLLGQLAGTLRQFRQRDQLAARDLADLVFLRIAHVEDEDLLLAIEALLQLINGDVRIVVGAHGGCGLLAADAAELF